MIAYHIYYINVSHAKTHRERVKSKMCFLKKKNFNFSMVLFRDETENGLEVSDKLCTPPFLIPVCCCQYHTYVTFHNVLPYIYD